ncbi:glycosyltransferase family 2 protein [Sporomusa malonica]|uniref:Glycosyltransferase involved in cell wall bisynthesis n=1 Tax=Sporomusa malonica TaxID=112901 RepID=A0A1W1YSL7_9FIRM|nr:glycosyltransferase [Sporomusa malonica]SMC39102.1 Glycosyltransferase involved in cell wall bisynthesis [Sporomusa malonica]
MGKQHPIVSVVIPAYNAGQTIERTIQSVLNQTYQQYEIIVVDDGSSDDTAEKIRKYGDLVQYISQTNAGAGAARNTGVRSAKGKWIAFLDSDDEWHPKKLEIQIQFCNSIPDIVLVTNVPTIIRIGEEKDFAPVSETPAYSIWNHEAFLRRNKIQTSSVLISKDAYEAVGGCDTSLLNAQDRDLWLKLLYRGTGICINESLSKYYHLNTGLSRNLVRRFQCDLILIDRWDHRKSDTLDVDQRIPVQKFIKIKYAVLFSMIFKLLRFNHEIAAKQFWHIFYEFHNNEYPYLPCPPWGLFKTLVYFESQRQRWKYGLK